VWRTFDIFFEFAFYGKLYENVGERLHSLVRERCERLHLGVQAVSQMPSSAEHITHETEGCHQIGIIWERKEKVGTFTNTSVMFMGLFDTGRMSSSV
jgi:hypothetical protein